MGDITLNVRPSVFAPLKCKDRYDIICFSHLRWDGVYQRPQHLLSRLAKFHRVIFIEEPEYSPTEPYLERISSGTPNVEVFRPRMSAHYPFFVGDQISTIDTLVHDLLLERNITHYIVWLYSPMAFPVAEKLRPVARVFDCMDELSGFRFAPNELLERDRAAMTWADLVLTGGVSIYNSRRQMHPNIYCFPSSVDAEHFRGALKPSTYEPAIQATLPRPRLGFFGVIDERMDLELLRYLANSRPQWQFVMIGPIVKIEEAELPRFNNLHYFGQQDYKLLPAYLKGWDVALMPFAINAATRFISPTKLLEYMAAERPIVSTPIPDVIQYKSCVLLADNHESFLSACEAALRANPVERAEWLERMRAIVSTTSWDQSVARITELIDTITIRKSSMLPQPTAPIQD